MPYRDEGYILRVQFQTQHCEISPELREQLDAELDTLRNVVRDFPVADLHIGIRQHPRVKDFHVKTSLRLPGKTLFTGERHVLLHPAYERCIHKIINKLKSYKEGMSRKPEYAKAALGIQADVRPEREPDIAAVERAAGAMDYSAFRRALIVYDDALEHRIGRWVQRYPQMEEMLRRDLLISDIVEEVYVNAFEQFPARPADRLGNWLESLIDPSIRALIRNPEAELDKRNTIEGTSPPEPAPRKAGRESDSGRGAGPGNR